MQNQKLALSRNGRTQAFAFLKAPYHPIWTMLLIWFQRLIRQYANPLFITPSENIILSEAVVIPLYTHTGPGNEDFDAGNGLMVATSDSMPETLYAVSVDLENGGLPLEGINKENILGAWYIGTLRP